MKRQQTTPWHTTMANSLSRRQALERMSMGFGSVALAGLLAQKSDGSENNLSSAGIASPTSALPATASLKQTHHLVRAKHVIFCYMSGGVSHVDSFDPKPELTRRHGQPMPGKVERTQFNNNGNLMASPFPFRRWGESGLPISSLFPRLGEVADELAVVRSMTTPVNEHAQGNFLMHSGMPFMGHPSAGAWCAYGLGTENENLPGYVVLQSGNATPPHGGVALFSNGFLPAHSQGSILQADEGQPLRNVQPDEPLDWQRQRLELAKQFDTSFLSATDNHSQVAAAIANYELAFRMQVAVPEVCDIRGEPEPIRQKYGLDSPDPQLAAYGRQCLLARRLVQQGVRFVELSCLPQDASDGQAANPWDQHGELEKGHARMAKQVDQPIAALIQDLRDEGLLEETLVVWAGEFGRTPFSQGSNGRDHNPMGFSVWLAGGGIRGGTVLGATDELGYRAIEDRCDVFDLWATVLHLLGVDHERLTYRYGGRDFRLTDVHGRVLRQILAAG